MSEQKRILIAEDEKPLARALSLKLERVGIGADLAYDGDMVKEFVAKGGYALILTDLMMPKHDSFAFIEDLRKNGDETPVVVMSNLSQDTDRKRAEVAGAEHYFIKSDTQLSEIVDYIVKRLAA